jgi:hypothetical protein
MDEQPLFDIISANRFFAAECFNSAWELMEKPARTPAEDEQMLLRAFASFFHWTQRPDCTPENRSISLWQLARIYALLRQPEAARRFGEQCRLEAESRQLSPFYRGYAYESLARAEMVAGNPSKVAEYLTIGRQMAAALHDDKDGQTALLNDLATIQ